MPLDMIKNTKVTSLVKTFSFLALAIFLSGSAWAADPVKGSLSCKVLPAANESVTVRCDATPATAFSGDAKLHIDIGGIFTQDYATPTVAKTYGPFDDGDYLTIFSLSGSNFSNAPEFRGRLSVDGGVPAWTQLSYAENPKTPAKVEASLACDAQPSGNDVTVSCTATPPTLATGETRVVLQGENAFTKNISGLNGSVSFTDLKDGAVAKLTATFTSPNASNSPTQTFDITVQDGQATVRPSGNSGTQDGTADDCGPLTCPVNPGGVPEVTTFGAFMALLLDFLRRIAIYVAVLFVIIAGFQYITDRGKEKGSAEAKESLVNIGLGLGVIALAQTAVEAFYNNGEFAGAAGRFWAQVLKPIVNFLEVFALGWAIVFFVIAGVRMVSGGEEGVKKARATIGYGLVGLLVIAIAEASVAVFARGGALDAGVEKIASRQEAANLGNRFVVNVLDPLSKFIVSFAGALAVFFVIKAGYDFLTSGGDEAQAKKAKSEVGYAVAGLLVIALSETVIRGAVYVLDDSHMNPTVRSSEVIKTIMFFINFLLSFVGSIALAMAIYAGFLILTGNKDKGQSILQYTAIGILVIIFAYSIVNILMTGGRAYV